MGASYNGSTLGFGPRGESSILSVPVAHKENGMNKRITLTVDSSTDQKIRDFSIDHGISVSEAIRWLMSAGFIIKRELELGNSIYSESENSHLEVIFPQFKKETYGR